MSVVKYLLIATFVSVVSLVSCAPDTYTLSLSLTLFGDEFDDIDSIDRGTCIGKGGYRDLDAGKQVRVLDGDHNVIGVGSWSVGEYEDLGQFPAAIERMPISTSEQFSAKLKKQGDYIQENVFKMLRGQEYDKAIFKASCTFRAEIEVPRSDLYQIEGRGNYTVTFDEMKANDWELNLSLGR